MYRDPNRTLLPAPRDPTVPIDEVAGATNGMDVPFIGYPRAINALHAIDEVVPA